MVCDDTRRGWTCSWSYKTLLQTNIQPFWNIAKTENLSAAVFSCLFWFALFWNDIIRFLWSVVPKFTWSPQYQLKSRQWCWPLPMFGPPAFGFIIPPHCSTGVASKICYVIMLPFVGLAWDQNVWQTIRCLVTPSWPLTSQTFCARNNPACDHGACCPHTVHHKDHTEQTVTVEQILFMWITQVLKVSDSHMWSRNLEIMVRPLQAYTWLFLVFVLLSCAVRVHSPQMLNPKSSGDLLIWTSGQHFPWRTRKKRNLLDAWSFYPLAHSYYPEDEPPPLWALTGYLTIKRADCWEICSAYSPLNFNNPMTFNTALRMNLTFSPILLEALWGGKPLHVAHFSQRAQIVGWAELFSFIGIFIYSLSGSHFKSTSESSSLVAMEMFLHPTWLQLTCTR